MDTLTGAVQWVEVDGSESRWRRVEVRVGKNGAVAMGGSR